MIGTCSGTHIVNQGVSAERDVSEARPSRCAVASERPRAPHLFEKRCSMISSGSRRKNESGMTATVWRTALRDAND